MYIRLPVKCPSILSDFNQTGFVSTAFPTILLIYSMVHSPSWEANWFAASQEIPRISRKPKVHWHTHKSPPPVSILGQTNPVHIPSSQLLEFHPNIIHSSTRRSPQRFSNNLRTSYFTKLSPVKAELFHGNRRTDERKEGRMDGQTNRHDETDSRFSQFHQRT